MLRNRLVCGVNDSRIQRQLLAETDLTFGKALELTQALEAAEQNAKDVASQFVVHYMIQDIQSFRFKDSLPPGTQALLQW